AGSQPLNPITRITSFFSEREVGVVTIAEPDALAGALEQLGPVVDREPSEGTVRFEGTEPQPVEPRPGQRLDVPAAGEVLKREWANGEVVALPIAELPPTTTSEDVTAAIEQVPRPALAAPITAIGEDDVRGPVDPEVIAAAMRAGAHPELACSRGSPGARYRLCDGAGSRRDLGFVRRARRRRPAQGLPRRRLRGHRGRARRGEGEARAERGHRGPRRQAGGG